MKNLRILALSTFLILTASFFATISIASSETFSLLEASSVSRIVFANAGDRIVGNFTISNIPIFWNEPFTRNLRTVPYGFKITKIEDQFAETVIYEEIQTKHSSFDVRCEYTGDYRLRFNVGGGNPAAGIGDMQATLNYEVVMPSSNSSSASNDQSEAAEISISADDIGLIVTLPILMLAVFGLYIARRTKLKAKESEQKNAK